MIVVNQVQKRNVRSWTLLQKGVVPWKKNSLCLLFCRQCFQKQEFQTQPTVSCSVNYAYWLSEIIVRYHHISLRSLCFKAGKALCISHVKLLRILSKFKWLSVLRFPELHPKMFLDFLHFTHFHAFQQTCPIKSPSGFCHSNCLLLGFINEQRHNKSKFSTTKNVSGFLAWVEN